MRIRAIRRTVVVARWLTVEWIEHFRGRYRRLVGARLARTLREYALDGGLFAASTIALSVSETRNALGNLLEANGNWVHDSRNGLSCIGGLECVRER